MWQASAGLQRCWHCHERHQQLTVIRLFLVMVVDMLVPIAATNAQHAAGQ